MAEDRDIVVYRGKKYYRYPNSTRQQLRNYYWHHGAWKKPPIALHVQIWIDNFGPIEKGFVIHHIDGDPLNNDVSNLECITQAEHMHKHYADKEWADRTKSAMIIGHAKKYTKR